MLIFTNAATEDAERGTEEELSGYLGALLPAVVRINVHYTQLQYVLEKAPQIYKDNCR
jgi:hypothetical protein